MTTSSGDEAPTAPCRFCGELVQPAARKCRFCGEWLDESLRDAVRGKGAPVADTPVVLKVWGALVMGFSALLALLQLGQVIYMAFLFGGQFGPSILLGLGMSMSISLLILLVLGRLGWGLWHGQRMAVVGMAVLGTLSFLLLIPLFMGGGAAEIGVALALVSVAYLPPIASGFASWRRLI